MLHEFRIPIPWIQIEFIKCSRSRPKIYLSGTLHFPPCFKVNELNHMLDFIEFVYSSAVAVLICF